MDKKTKQFLITPAAGKRLIAKAFALLPEIKEALTSRTIVVIAGTTNGYIAEELLKVLGAESIIDRRRFFRGVVLPTRRELSESGRLKDESRFLGDLVIRSGVPIFGETIFDVSGGLKAGDIIVKGANAVNLERGEAAVLIGHPESGTVLPALGAAVGRRVRLFVPVGLEKRVTGEISALARLVNDTDCAGFRLMPIYGQVFTELDAVRLLSACSAVLMAAGGVSGAEGGVWLAVSGNGEQLKRFASVYEKIKDEPNFEV